MKIILFIIQIFLLLVHAEIICKTPIKIPLIKPISIITSETNSTQLNFHLNQCNNEDFLEKQWKVISIVGPYHTGKSFLMNSLINTTNIFEIGETNKPKTNGIDMYIDENENIIYLDTEGFANGKRNIDMTHTFDRNLFAVAALSSDLLIYNSIRTIDQNQLEYLHKLVEETQLYSIKQEMKKRSSDIRQFNQFPSLYWVIHDYQYDETANELMQQLLLNKDHEKSISMKKKGKKESQKSLLQRIFDNMKVFTLSLPHTDKSKLKKLSIDCLDDTYLKNTEKLRQSSHIAVSGTQKPGKIICETMKKYVEIANSDEFQKIPDYYDVYIPQILRFTKEIILNEAEKKIQYEEQKSKGYSTKQDIRMLEIDLEMAVKEIAKKNLYGNIIEKHPLLTEVKQEIKMMMNQFIKNNEKKIREKMANTITTVKTTYQDIISFISIPQPENELMKQIQNIKNNFKTILKNNDELEQFKQDFNDILENEIKLLNFNETEIFLSKVDENAKVYAEKYDSIFKTIYDKELKFSAHKYWTLSGYKKNFFKRYNKGLKKEIPHKETRERVVHYYINHYNLDDFYYFTKYQEKTRGKFIFLVTSFIVIIGIIIFIVDRIVKLCVRWFRRNN